MGEFALSLSFTSNEFQFEENPWNRENKNEQWK